nr:hypothetical protein [Tanacetum cinerariifolium]
MTLEKTIEDGLGPYYKKLATLEEGVSKMTRMLMEEKKKMTWFDREDLHQLWTLVKENFSIRPSTKDKEKELCVELKRLFKLDFEDHLWIHNQAFMHDPLDWKLYDTCGIHNVFSKDQEIFMLVEKDYPLRRGLATVMICNKLQAVDLNLRNNTVDQAFANAHKEQKMIVLS